MQASFFLFLASLWLSAVAALSVDSDFNGTIPSILGITNFSYPSTPDQFPTTPDLQSGYADGTLHDHFHQLWPDLAIGNARQHIIRYCYADQASKDALTCAFRRALNLWSEALGGPPSAANGYSLFFFEVYKDMQAQPCYTEGTYNSKTAQGTWNWKLADKQDMLVMSWRSEDEHGRKPATAASLGYTPDHVLYPWSQKQARHFMQIVDAEDEVKIAHELGHVFGLVHEHQRSDRDQYMVYHPENIIGYQEALAAAMKDGVPEDEAREKLRDDNQFCQKYNFPGTAYIKGAGQTGTIQGNPDTPDDFDFDSIMIYPSDAFTDTIACHNDLTKCPIARKNGKDAFGNDKLEFMPVKTKPSAKDAEFIKKEYPWLS